MFLIVRMKVWSVMRATWFNLETVVGRKKAVEDIGVHGEIQKVVVTSVVMRHFCILPGAPRACADFCDPTPVSRFHIHSNDDSKKSSDFRHGWCGRIFDFSG